jgi:hypothetical protein
MTNLDNLFKDNRSLKYIGSLKYIAQWDEKNSDIAFKEIKHKDFYKKRKKNE